jgi:anti-sigma regulatory factor (Ser/Thr protein kinase)
MRALLHAGGLMNTARVADVGDTFTWDLTARTWNIGLWRDQAAAAVAAFGGDEVAVSLARLGSSELLSNVIKHVQDTRCQLAVEPAGDYFYVKVRDRSLQVPAVTVPEWDAESGRGLWLLREMTDAIGYTCFPEGKLVWFRCRLTAGGREPAA